MALHGPALTRAGPAVTLEIDLADTAYDLGVTLAYRVFDGFDVLERWATLRHHGSGPPIVIRQAHSANWWLPDRGRWRLRYLHGGWGAETQLTQTTLGPGKVVLESRRGTTSHQLNPWFTLDPDGSATEESGEVWSGELAWSGSWKLVFETTSAGRVHACGGWNDFDWAYRLAPGEELVLPAFAGLYTAGGFGGDLTRWGAAELAEARELIGTYKAIRPVVQRGRLHRLASVGRDPLAAWEYVAGDGSEVVVLAWWGPRPAGDPLPALRLRGTDPGARYRDAGSGREHRGAELMRQGLRLPADAEFDFGSVPVRLVRSSGPA